MTTSNPHQAFDNRVASLVREYWNEHKLPLLLSRLGSEDDGNVARLAKQRAGSLAAYLQTQIPDRVRVIQHTAKHAVVAAIPAEVNVSSFTDSVDTLLDDTLASTAKMRSTPHYHPAFWAAFRKPLEN